MEVVLDVAAHAAALSLAVGIICTATPSSGTTETLKKLTEIFQQFFSSFVSMASNFHGYFCKPYLLDCF